MVRQDLEQNSIYGRMLIEISKGSHTLRKILSSVYPERKKKYLKTRKPTFLVNNLNNLISIGLIKRNKKKRGHYEIKISGCVTYIKKRIFPSFKEDISVTFNDPKLDNFIKELDSSAGKDDKEFLSLNKSILIYLRSFSNCSTYQNLTNLFKGYVRALVEKCIIVSGFYNKENKNMFMKPYFFKKDMVNFLKECCNAWIQDKRNLLKYIAFSLMEDDKKLPEIKIVFKEGDVKKIYSLNKKSKREMEKANILLLCLYNKNDDRLSIKNNYIPYMDSQTLLYKLKTLKNLGLIKPERKRDYITSIRGILNYIDANIFDNSIYWSFGDSDQSSSKQEWDFDIAENEQPKKSKGYSCIGNNCNLYKSIKSYLGAVRSIMRYSVIKQNYAPDSSLHFRYYVDSVDMLLEPYLEALAEKYFFRPLFLKEIIDYEKYEKSYLSLRGFEEEFYKYRNHQTNHFYYFIRKCLNYWYKNVNNDAIWNGYDIIYFFTPRFKYKAAGGIIRFAGLNI